MNNQKQLPDIVSGFKWTGGPDQMDDPEWIIEAIEAGKVRFENEGTPGVRLLLETPDGVVPVSQGDFILRDASGALYRLSRKILDAVWGLLPNPGASLN